MIKDKDLLLEQADKWFTVTYETTPESQGMHCRKIWKKNILPFKTMREVVYGPDEKEVDAFIKAQKLIRGSVNLFICLIPVLAVLMMYSALTINVPVLCFLCGFSVVCGLICCFLGSYVKPLEKCYKGKVVTYLEQ